MAEPLSGVIERVTFHNAESGFAVLRVEVKGKRGLVTVVGQVPRAVVGEYLEATGQWVEDREHGQQFKAESIRTAAPSTAEGIEKYLGSGLIKGIGPHFAKKIVKVFGEKTLDVIDASPAFLKEIKGIGPRRIQQIRESWQQQKAVRQIMVFLQSHGVGTARAFRIWKTYGDKALDLVKANPYRLANDIWGVGFQTADDLAQRLGIDRQSPLRAQAALRYVLQQFTADGHTCYPEPDVVEKTVQLTGIEPGIVVGAVGTLIEQREVVREVARDGEALSPLPPYSGGEGQGEGGQVPAGESVPPTATEEGRTSPRDDVFPQGGGAIARHATPPHPDPLPPEYRRERGQGQPPPRVAPSGVTTPSPLTRLPLVLRRGEPDSWLYLRNLHHAEVEVARTLHELLAGRHPLGGIDVDAALGWVEKKINLQLAPGQREAIRQAVTRKVLVITGGPGVGKTTIVRGILEIFLAKKLNVACCAPTGRAAKRLAETTGREARTIHRLLEFDQSGPKRGRDRPLDCDLLIVDETSMVDISLMHHLVKALSPRACLLMVGDVDQLPSVGPGMVLADIIASGAVPVARLTEIFRQAQESGIVRAAHLIHEGDFPEIDPGDKLSDFYYIDVDEPRVIAERIVSLIQERIPARFGLDRFQDIQVLTPMNRSELGVRSLNQQLQSILNPTDDEHPEVQRFGTAFRVGDKVLQTVNNYDKEVFNGDIGRVNRVDHEAQELSVRFDSQTVVYDFDELDELSLAYALTIHKSQGSEYPAVIIPLHTQHYLMLQRNLLYTGVTRGKKLVVIVGSRKALSLAVSRQDTRRRVTGLRKRLT